MILAYLQQTVQLNLPISTMLRAAERSERGVLRQWYGDLAVALESGGELGLSMSQTVGAMPRRSCDLVAAAERIGRLPQILARLVSRDRRANQATPWETPFGHPWLYGLLVVVVLGVVLLGCTIIIVPKFEKIFDDFGIALPLATRVLQTVSHWLLGRAYPAQWVPGLLYLVCVPLLLVFVWPLVRNGIGRTVLDRVAWHVPFVHALVRDLGLADVCHILAEATHAGVPLGSALEEAAQLDLNGVLRDRIQHWGQEVRSGRPPHEAARLAGMHELLVGMLSTAQSTDDAPRVFGFLARYYESRFSRTLTLLQGAWVPGIVLVLGVAVGFFAVAMFLPLVELIWSASLQTGLL